MLRFIFVTAFLAHAALAAPIAEDRWDLEAERELSSFVDGGQTFRFSGVESSLQSMVDVSAGHWLTSWLAIEGRAEALYSASFMDILGDSTVQEASGFGAGAGLRVAFPVQASPYASISYRYTEQSVRWTENSCFLFCEAFEPQHNAAETRRHVADSDIGMHFGLGRFSLRTALSMGFILSQDSTLNIDGVEQRVTKKDLDHLGGNVAMGVRF